MWEFRDERIFAMHLYATTEQALRVAEERERASGRSNSSD
jgi:hypothetical protein